MTKFEGGVLEAIGNTPLIQLASIVPEGAAEVWVKLEGGNPTASYKDRMAVSLLTNAVRRGDVSPGTPSLSSLVAAPGPRWLLFPPCWDSTSLQCFQMPFPTASGWQWKRSARPF